MIREDIWFLDRVKLDATCAAYCSLKESEVRPSEVQGFFDNSVTTEERERRFDESRANLSMLLKRIIECT